VPSSLYRNDEGRHEFVLGASPESNAVVETRSTVWIGQDHDSNNATVGIVIVDSTFIAHRPVNRHPDTCYRTPDSGSHITSLLPRPTGPWFKDLVEVTSRYPWFASTHATDARNQSAVVCLTIYTVCAGWLSVCQLAEVNLASIEYALRYPSASAPLAPQIDRSLSRAKEWRGYIRSSCEMVRETLAQSLPAAASFTAGTTNTPTTNSALDSIMPDFKRIMPRLEKLETRVERLIDRCTSEMQLSAARESLAESHNLAQLTWLSTIFVPLTFVASLFSMNENIGSLKDTLVTYFASAVPFAIVTLLVARWGVDLARFVRMVLHMVWRRDSRGLKIVFAALYGSCRDGIKSRRITIAWHSFHLCHHGDCRYESYFLTPFATSLYRAKMRFSFKGISMYRCSLVSR
jgi:hypothetical protein